MQGSLCPLRYGDSVLTRALRRPKPPGRWSYGAAWLFTVALGRNTPRPQRPLAKRRRMRWTGLTCENTARSEAAAWTSLHVLAPRLHQSVEIIVRRAARGGRIRIFTHMHRHVACTVPVPSSSSLSVLCDRWSTPPHLLADVPRPHSHPPAVLAQSSAPNGRTYGSTERSVMLALALASLHPHKTCTAATRSGSARTRHSTRGTHLPLRAGLVERCLPLTRTCPASSFLMPLRTRCQQASRGCVL